MGAPPSGFEHRRQADGTVKILHRGRHATTLRGARAEAFLGELAVGDPQLVMDRWTGNYRRGSERVAKNHPRNRGR